MNNKKLSLIGLTSLLSMGLITTSCDKGSDPSTLNVIVLNRGYGREWIDDIVTKWEAANPGYKVKLTADSSAPDFIDKDISSRKNADDVYISVGAKWKNYAVAGKLLELDDLLEEEVDGVKVKNKINDEYKDSIYYTNRKGIKKSYRLPWTAGIGGIYYNAKMFEENGWSVPTTYEQLVTLCQTIREAQVVVNNGDLDEKLVKPLVFTGQNTDYFDYAVLTWWGQLAGKENIQNFLKYDNKDNFNVAKNSTYAALKEATGMWYNLFKDSPQADENNRTNLCNYVDGSKSMSNHAAQQAFFNGYAAMMFDGEWIYNEIQSYNASRNDFEIKIMPTPAKSNAPYKNTAYVVGEDQYIAIPASTSKPELAKSFVKAVISDDGCKTFTEKAHGMLAYNWDQTSFKSSNQNTYLSSVLDYRNSLTSTFTNFSDSALYYNGIIDIWGTGALRPFESLLGTISLDTAFTNIATQTSNQWSTWLSQAGVN